MSAAEKMVSLVRIHFENYYPSFGSPWGIWWKLRFKKDRDENLLGLKVCFGSMDEAENKNHGVVGKRSVVSKSGLCFNLAQLTLHSSWHVLGCVHFTSVWSALVCACACFSRHVRLHSASLYQTGVLCGCTYWDTERAIEVYTDC